jgi:hypothetical protein
MHQIAKINHCETSILGVNEIAVKLVERPRGRGVGRLDSDELASTPFLRSAGFPRFRPTAGFLLQHGAHPDAKTKDGEPALKAA